MSNAFLLPFLSLCVSGCFCLKFFFCVSFYSWLFFSVFLFLWALLYVSVWVKLVGNRVAPISGIKGSDTAGGGGGGGRGPAPCWSIIHTKLTFSKEVPWNCEIWELVQSTLYSLRWQADWWMFSIAQRIRWCGRRWCKRRWSSSMRYIVSENYQPAPWRWWQWWGWGCWRWWWRWWWYRWWWHLKDVDDADDGERKEAPPPS